jgi:hypothetical protein
MSHLTIETMARLVDETPTAEQSVHLASCDVCRAELEALCNDVRVLSTLPDMTPAPDAWDALAQRLGAEGLMRAAQPTALRFRPLLQAAAAVVLFVAGLALGRGIGESATNVARNDTPAAPAAADAAPQRAPDVEVGPVVGQAPLLQPQPVTNPAVTFAGSGDAQRYATPRTMDEAAALLRQTEDLYLGALTRYAELATQAAAGDPVARLAALQSIVMTTQAALSQTPTDPVINGYHLTALAQRDATLRQVAAATSDRWY